MHDFSLQVKISFFIDFGSLFSIALEIFDWHVLNRVDTYDVLFTFFVYIHNFFVLS